MDACEKTPLLRLNLGCGSNKIAGYLNVDKYGEPDMVVDLERRGIDLRVSWPWADNTVEKVVMSHVLEHLGADADTFIGIMKELYRVCINGARIEIAVPHPRHDNFIGDPTHVRVVTPQVLSLFSKRNCEEWASKGYANSPLALYHDVDFETVAVEYVPDWKFQKLPPGHLTEMAAHQNNVIAEIRMVLEVRK